MKIQSYIDDVAKAREEAAAFVEQSETLKTYQQILAYAQWNDFYDKTGVPEARSAFHGAQDYLAHELMEPVAIALIREEITEPDFVKQLHDAETKFHYRFLEVLKKTPEEVNPDWVSKSLSRSTLIDYLKKHCPHTELVDRHRYGRGFSDLEHHVAEAMYQRKIGQICISFYDAKDSKFPLKDMFLDMAQNADPRETLGVIVDMANRADGRYSHYPLEEMTNRVVAKAARVLFKDANIGASDIYRLRESGEVKPIRYWDTNYFLDNLAPVTTDEYLEKAKGWVDSRERHSPFMQIKDQLTKPEILTHFFHGRSGMELSDWTYAMAAFEVVTGERISFRQAREMKLPNFDYRQTQAYSDLVDSQVNPRLYRDIRITVEANPESNHVYQRGERAAVIAIDCASISIEDISEALSNELLKHEGMKECGTTSSGMWFEMVTTQKDWKGHANQVGHAIVKVLEQHNRLNPLPGDIVKVDHNDAEDEWGLKNGIRALVTDVDLSGNIKLQGDYFYYPAELFEITKKFDLKKDVSMGLSR